MNFISRQSLPSCRVTVEVNKNVDVKAKVQRFNILGFGGKVLAELWKDVKGLL